MAGASVYIGEDNVLCDAIMTEGGSTKGEWHSVSCRIGGRSGHGVEFRK